MDAATGATAKARLLALGAVARAPLRAACGTTSTPPITAPEANLAACKEEWLITVSSSKR